MLRYPTFLCDYTYNRQCPKILQLGNLQKTWKISLLSGPSPAQWPSAHLHLIVSTLKIQSGPRAWSQSNARFRFSSIHPMLWPFTGQSFPRSVSLLPTLIIERFRFPSLHLVSNVLAIHCTVLLNNYSLFERDTRPKEDGLWENLWKSVFISEQCLERHWHANVFDKEIRNTARHCLWKYTVMYHQCSVAQNEKRGHLRESSIGTISRSSHAWEI